MDAGTDEHDVVVEHEVAGVFDEEFVQCPWHCSKQFEHSLFAFLHKQFLQRPLALHRQQTGGIPHVSSRGEGERVQSRLLLLQLEGSRVVLTSRRTVHATLSSRKNIRV